MTHPVLPLWQLTLFALAWGALVRILAGRLVRDIGKLIIRRVSILRRSAMWPSPEPS